MLTRWVFLFFFSSHELAVTIETITHRRKRLLTNQDPRYGSDFRETIKPVVDDALTRVRMMMHDGCIDTYCIGTLRS